MSHPQGIRWDTGPPPPPPVHGMEDVAPAQQMRSPLTWFSVAELRAEVWSGVKEDTCLHASSTGMAVLGAGDCAHSRLRVLEVRSAGEPAVYSCRNSLSLALDFLKNLSR